MKTWHVVARVSSGHRPRAVLCAEYLKRGVTEQVDHRLYEGALEVVVHASRDWWSDNGEGLTVAARAFLSGAGEVWW